MAKKAAQNRYGVQVGDVFNWKSHSEDGNSHAFYQVIALRGETQVVVKEIGKKVIAFDGVYEGVVPVSDLCVSDEEEIFVRKVHDMKGARNVVLKMFEDGACSVSIKIFDNWSGHAYLERKEMYLEWDSGRSFAHMFEKYNPGLAKQLDLESGSGVYAADGAFKTYGDDCCAIIRYPDGKEEKVILRELLHYEEEQREYERMNSPEVQKARKELLEQWIASQNGASDE